MTLIVIGVINDEYFDISSEIKPAQNQLVLFEYVIIRVHFLEFWQGKFVGE